MTDNKFSEIFFITEKSLLGDDFQPFLEPENVKFQAGYGIHRNLSSDFEFFIGQHFTCTFLNMSNISILKVKCAFYENSHFFG